MCGLKWGQLVLLTSMEFFWMWVLGLDSVGTVFSEEQRIDGF